MRLVFRKVVIAVAFLTALGVAETIACPSAEASYGARDALETMGIATGIGAVMGLSTIAFYDSPTQHFRNVLMGAGAGLIVGFGVAAYLLANASESDEINPEELLPPGKKPGVPGKVPAKDPGKTQGQSMEYRLSPKLRFASVPATFAIRDSSDWTVALQVLELRF